MQIKWLKIPFGEKNIPAAKTWRVSWFGRAGEFYGNIFPCVEVFVDEQSAHEFAVSLRNAFKILKISGDKTGVKVELNAA